MIAELILAVLALVGSVFAWRRGVDSLARVPPALPDADDGRGPGRGRDDED
jgi:hypothetical protein